MLITKEVLQDLKACKDGLSWWVNNGLTSFDSDNLKHIKGDYKDYISWLKNEFYNPPVRTYDVYGNILTSKNNNDYSKEYTYDIYGNRLTCKDSSGYSITFTYDKYGNMLTCKDNNNNYSKEYTYDEYGNELTLKDSDDYTAEYTYDEYGNMLTCKDSNCYSITYAHIHTDKSYIIKENGKIILNIPKDIK